MTTVGLVSKDEYKRKLTEMYTLEERKLQNSTQQYINRSNSEYKARESESSAKNKENIEKKQKEKQKVVLSFDDEEEQGGEDPIPEEPQQKKTIKKNPAVDTSFLPDKERDLKLAQERRRMIEEFYAQQERLKSIIFQSYVIFQIKILIRSTAFGMD